MMNKHVAMVTINSLLAEAEAERQKKKKKTGLGFISCGIIHGESEYSSVSHRHRTSPPVS